MTGEDIGEGRGGEGEEREESSLSYQ